jgi:hypothetical protein
VEKSSGTFNEKVLDQKFLTASLRYICSGSQPTFGMFQMPDTGTQDKILQVCVIPKLSVV